MICQECNKNEAQVFFKQILNNQVTQYRLCPECAQKKGLSSTAADFFLEMLAGIGGLLGVEEGKGGASRLRCSVCGSRLSDLQESGRLGCPGCYESFREPLADLLRRIHGSNRHLGKRPREGAGPRRRPEVLLGEKPRGEPARRSAESGGPASQEQALSGEAAGQAPGSGAARLSSEVTRLRQSLQAAIGREDFEEAARIRDQIRKLEGRQ